MFSKTTEYALRATIFIAQSGSEGKKLAIGEISTAIDSPPSFTAKILQNLTVNNKIISSVRGPKGGFFITEKAKNFPVSVILKAMGEEGIFSECILGLKQCNEINPCPLHNEYKPIRQKIIQLFENKTIRDLANDLHNGETYLNTFLKTNRRK